MTQLSSKARGGRFLEDGRLIEGNKKQPNLGIFYKDCNINVCSSIITHTKGILLKNIAIEYKPINLVVIIFVPLLHYNLTPYSNFVILLNFENIVILSFLTLLTLLS